jgi:hypothetical protein
MIFSKPEINTITCFGSVYSDKNASIRISKLSKHIEIKTPVIYTKYIEAIPIKLKYSDEYITNNLGNLIKNPWFDKSKGDELVPTSQEFGNILYNRKKILVCTMCGKESEMKRDFDNSFTIGMKIGESNINCKIYVSGYILITGCSSENDITDTFNALNDILTSIYTKSNNEEIDDILVAPHISKCKTYMKLSEFNTEDRTKIVWKIGIFAFKPSPKLTRILLMTYKFDSGIEFDQEKIQELVNGSNNSDIYATFENSKNRTLKINHMT